MVSTWPGASESDAVLGDSCGAGGGQGAGGSGGGPGAWGFAWGAADRAISASPGI